MSGAHADENAPKVQGLDMFEVYEDSGALLVVTSDLTSVNVAPTDVVYRRPWATAAPAVRRPTLPGSPL